jgi:hypothetical protein
MADDIISMDDMMALYEVTDRFGIDREQISVPLEKSGGGSLSLQPSGVVEITVPANVPTRDWLPVLEADLKSKGFLEVEEDDDF